MRRRRATLGGEKLSRTTTIIAVAAALVLALAPVASAHVAVQPSEAASGAFVREDVRVPNEQDNASTTKVEVQFPDGFTDASYAPVPGWRVKVKKEKLAQPVKNDEGQEITEQVKRITWSGGKIAPGQFQDFPVSVQIPGKAGDALTFKAIQTYDNGDVVRWIGPPDAEEPAPQIKVTAAESENAATTTPASSSSSGGDDDSKTLAIIALIVGGLGLVAGGAALATRRRA
jgi:periplasmic copper chaperone A